LTLNHLRLTVFDVFFAARGASDVMPPKDFFNGLSKEEI